jgi:hypothetical protein
LNPVSALGEWATRNQIKIARAREQFDSREESVVARGRPDLTRSGLVQAARRT